MFQMLSPTSTDRVSVVVWQEMKTRGGMCLFNLFPDQYECNEYKDCKGADLVR